MSNIIKQKKGVALLTSLLLLSVFIVLTAILVSASTKEARFAFNTVGSNNAYNAAASGIEIGRYYVDKNIATNGGFGGSFNSTDPGFVAAKDNWRPAFSLEATSDIVITKSTEEYLIKSTAVMGETRRVIEYKVKKSSVGTEITEHLYKSPYIFTGSNNGNSFELKANFTIPNTTDEIKIGLKDPTNTKRLYIHRDGSGNWKIVGYVYGRGEIPSETVAIPLGEFSEYPERTPRLITATLRYIKETSAILRLDMEYGNGCKAVKELSLLESKWHFGDLSAIFIDPTLKTAPINLSDHNDGFHVLDASNNLLKYTINYIFIKGVDVTPPPAQYTITLKSSPEVITGLTLNGAGTFDRWKNYAVSFTMNTNPSGYQFRFWAGDCSPTSNPTGVYLDRNKTCTAVFGFPLTLASNPSGVAGMSGATVYSVGSSATPRYSLINTNYAFTGWSGHCSGFSNPTVVYMTAPKSCTANFTLSSTNWIPGRSGTALAGKEVYKINSSTSRPWQSSNVNCLSPHCSTALDSPYMALVASNTVDFSFSYPARDACKMIGGRLPNRAELKELYDGHGTYGIALGVGYWSATESSPSGAFAAYFYLSGFNPITAVKANNHSTRCVKD